MTPLVVVAPNAFKGSLSAAEAAAAMVLGLKRACPECRIHSSAMADGGDGTLDILLAVLQGVEVRAPARDALGAAIEARYARVSADSGDQAILEAAQVVGFRMASGRIEHRTTLGLGDLFRHALDAGLRRFVVALGDTSTNEGGAGFLYALGARFLDTHGRPVVPTLQGLTRSAALDLATLDPRIASCTITVLADVDNPLLGREGATFCYGRQKGVPEDKLRVYDEILGRVARFYEVETGRSCADVPGSGAAGGLGLALLVLGAELEGGAEAVARYLDLPVVLASADWVLTGEGCSDLQTPRGKVPWVVARIARACGVDTTLISGRIDLEVLPVLRRHFAGYHDLTSLAVNPDEAHQRAFSLLVTATERAALVRTGRGGPAG